MKILSDVVKIIFTLLILAYEIYAIFYYDYCKVEKLNYLKVKLNLKVVKIPSDTRNILIEGYNAKGEYQYWHDPGNIFFNKRDNIAVGDSIRKNEGDSIFYVRKKISNGLLKFHCECE